MATVRIISSSVRDGRMSHRVALFFKKFIQEKYQTQTEILDLREFDFPVFHERLRYQKEPLPKALEFAEKVISADGIVVVTPEYNGGYPSALKNALDLLHAEWRRKPIAISTVSDGIFGGSQVITSLQFSLWKMKAWTVPALFPVPKIKEAFDEDGNPLDEEGVTKRATAFVDELFWCIQASEKMK